MYSTAEAEREGRHVKVQFRMSWRSFFYFFLSFFLELVKCFYLLVSVELRLEGRKFSTVIYYLLQ